MTLFSIVTAGAVDDVTVAFAASCLEEALRVEVQRLEPLPEPEYAWDTARSQYSSTLILRDGLKRRPPEAARLLVITDHDLFIPMLSFVYGQAQLDGPVAVVSLARLHQEFYGLPSDRALFLGRVRKEVLHEIGHTLGLTHCDDRSCTMSLSTNIQQVDAKGGDYCDGCATLAHEGVANAGLRALSGVTS